jgi:hypothetical protein
VFEASSSVLLLDYFRVPYTLRAVLRDRLGSSRPPGVASFERLARSDEGGGVLLWPKFESDGPRGPWQLGDLTLFGQVVRDDETEPWLRGRASGWEPILRIRGQGDEPVASIWRDSNGSVFVPFDPNEAIASLWSESYRLAAAGSRVRHWRRALVRAYYHVRPAIPRAAQIWLRRRLARLQARARFPAWPVETALHDLHELLLSLVAHVAGEAVPTIAPWPSGFEWALVLTHDVETEAGYGRIQPICDLEERLGYRSSWNLVPRRYPVADELVRRLTQSGFEVGVHGLYHDGRDLESRELLEERLPSIREWADRWAARGFRAPATHRNWAWMPLLGFDYDSSYPDTDPFEPQPGGCCSWLPYCNGELVELPITLPQDHTLFVILGHADASAWFEKADFLRERGGMALLITHPDYFHHRPIRDSYRALLERYAADETAWKPLPREVSAWWRRRASSALEGRQGRWRVVGPAEAEARVAFVHPSPPAHAA